jgi:hypothetical protein
MRRETEAERDRKTEKWAQKKRAEIADAHPCRFCKKDGANVKYGVRHYAHGRCFLVWKVRPNGPSATVRAALDTLPPGALGSFMLRDFDAERIVGTVAAVGMTMREFMDYCRDREVRS